LNDKQNDALLHILQWANKEILYEENPQLCLAPDQLLLFIHGGPGVGKSFFAKTVMSKIGVDRTCCAAPTGIAAWLSWSSNGRTFHDLLGLPAKAPHSPNIAVLQGDKAACLSLRLDSIRILIIDELSMVDHLLFSWINHKCTKQCVCVSPFVPPMSHSVSRPLSLMCLCLTLCLSLCLPRVSLCVSPVCPTVGMLLFYFL
jgi:hypothetical protein